jgi:hypothetical protein
MSCRLAHRVGPGRGLIAVSLDTLAYFAARLVTPGPGN